jgi:predicted enzyme related to lactoylglutathione lyase
MKLSLNVLRIFAKDWQASADFYEQVLELPLQFRDEAMGWAQFDAGGTSLAVERVTPGDAEGEALSGRFVGASLHTADIEAVYQSLCERGVKFVSAPEHQPWGGMLAHFEDPAGNVLTLLGDPEGGVDG